MIFQAVRRGFLSDPRSLLGWTGPGAKGRGLCPPRETGTSGLDRPSSARVDRHASASPGRRSRDHEKSPVRKTLSVINKTLFHLIVGGGVMVVAERR